MPISDNRRQELLASTRGAAVALLEDLQHFREVLKRPQPSGGELRRLSALLRRIIVDRDIAIVAAPRTGRIEFSAPDNNPYYKMAQQVRFRFFGSGGAEAFGIFIRALLGHYGSPMMPIGFHPDKKVPLRLDNFLQQRVLCFEGEWASRGDVIKYIANIASGVHSGTPRPREQQAARLIERMRAMVAYSANPKVTIQFLPTPQGITKEFSYSPDKIDPVLMELLATIHYLMLSEDVVRLESIIKTELGGA
jgi:hypothetical protein